MKEQAEVFGAELLMAEVLDMELEQDVKVLHTTAGKYRALGVVLATGANPRKLGFKGEKEFQGRGVAYCATCDGEFLPVWRYSSSEEALPRWRKAFS